MTEAENLPAVPTPQKVAAQDRSGRKRVTGKLKIAIEAMVWEGSKRKIAASAARMSDHGLRSALRKPHVLAFYHGELAALREGERARNVHRLAELRDQDDNRNAAVKATQVLEQISDDPAAPGIGQPRVPGVVIVIERATPQVGSAPVLIDVTPTEPTEQAAVESSPYRAASNLGPAPRQRFLDYDND